MPEFTVCAKSQVKKVVRDFDATHLITTLDPGDHVFRPARIEGVNHLRLAFDDEEDPSKLHAPTLAHAESILNFGKRLPADAKVVIHCFAGACRSPAVALALWLQANGVDKFQEAQDWMAEIRPRACPNMLLARHFDQLLNLDGKFVELCDKIGEASMARWWKEQEV